jgi:uncharacterized membrane protein
MALATLPCASALACDVYAGTIMNIRNILFKAVPVYNAAVNTFTGKLIMRLNHMYAVTNQGKIIRSSDETVTSVSMTYGTMKIYFQCVGLRQKRITWLYE